MAWKALPILSILLVLSSKSLVSVARDTGHAASPPSPLHEKDGRGMNQCLVKRMEGHPCAARSGPNNHAFGPLPAGPPVRSGLSYARGCQSIYSCRSGDFGGISGKCQYCVRCCSRS